MSSSHSPQADGGVASVRSPGVTPPPVVLSAGKRKALLASLGVSYLGLFMTYAGLVAILLPQQMTNLDAAHKVTNLAFVTSISGLPPFSSSRLSVPSRTGREPDWGVVHHGYCWAASAAAYARLPFRRPTHCCGLRWHGSPYRSCSTLFRAPSPPSSRIE